MADDFASLSAEFDTDTSLKSDTSAPARNNLQSPLQSGIGLPKDMTALVKHSSSKGKRERNKISFGVTIGTNLPVNVLTHIF